MTRALSLGASLTGVFVLAACAPTPSPDMRADNSAATVQQCMAINQVQNFRIDGNTLYLRGPRQAVFEVQATGACPDLDSSQRLDFLPQGGTGICVGSMIRVSGMTPPGPATRPCLARVVRSLTPEQLASLDENNRP